MTKLFTTVLFTVSIMLLFAQKPISLKEKGSPTRLKYYYLPELVGLDDCLSYSVDLKDLSGDSYEFLNDLTKPKPFQIQVGGKSFIDRMKKSSEGDLKIIIERINHDFSFDNKTIESSAVTTKKPDGTEAQSNVYNLDFFVSEKYSIQVLDMKKGGGSVFDTVIEFKQTTSWPKDYNQVNGYPSKDKLEKVFESYISDTTKNFKNRTDFLKSEKYLSYFYSIQLNKEINIIIVSKIDRNFDIKVVNTWMFKNKDERFALLDSAGIYMDQGFEQILQNVKGNSYLNSHEEKAYTNFNNAFRIFKKYYSDEFFTLLDEETRKTYEAKMRINLYNSAILSSNYELAEELYRKTEKEVIDSQVEVSSNPGIKEKAAFGFSQLSRTDAEKIMDEMDLIRDVQVREQKLYAIHSVHYSFFK